MGEGVSENRQICVYVLYGWSHSFFTEHLRRLLLKVKKWTVDSNFTQSEAVVWRCSVEKLFLKFRKIHRKTLVTGSLFRALDLKLY